MRIRTISTVLLGTVFTAAGAFEAVPDGISVATPGGSVRLKVVGDKIIRVSASPEKSFPADSSLIVIPQESKPRYKTGEKGRYAWVETSAVKATVDKKTGEVTFFDNKGKKILQEAERTFKPITVENTDAYTVSQRFRSLDDNEGIYGLGQHQSNEFNYKGKNEELFQYNTKVSVPFVVSTGGYGILWDSYSLCRWGNPEDYSQLGDIFKLYDKNGKAGNLTGTYIAADGKTIVREEPKIYFEHLIRGDLGHVVNLPRDFNYAGAKVSYEGELEPSVSGEYNFIMYYSGYQTIYIDNKKVVDRRWRTAWNPNSYKFSVKLEKGKRVPVKIECSRTEAWHTADCAHTSLSMIRPASRCRGGAKCRIW